MAAKDILLRPISRAEANEATKRLHYSGKVVNNSQLHIGVFYEGQLEGVMQFGPSLDKRKLQGLVADTKWNEFIELNRMAFSDALPRNSESRALGVAMRLLKKHCPHLKWVVSFADATQCGDGTIYRASGFVLTKIKPNDQIWQAPESEARESRLSLTDNSSHRQQAAAQRLCRVSATKGKGIINSIAARRNCGEHAGLNLQPGSVTHSASLRPGIGAIGTAARTGGGSSMKAYIEAGFKPLEGFQLRYLYFLDPTARERLTVPILPFTAIGDAGAGMYRGEKRASVVEATTSGDQPGSGGVESDPDAPILEAANG